ncbi:hypothetical protein [Ottowia sp.]|jgi:hypothetical protein|uniref:hypothetical protein n=1 Tax=Ottowia sp. TaxID=1898956 RepID=UPI0025FED24B|nr:hypothetical protein [Ottowia sp.]MBK6615707.1 hypothetical protein [Ottowia sp.]
MADVGVVNSVPLDSIVQVVGAIINAGAFIVGFIMTKPPVVVRQHPMFSHVKPLVAVIIGVSIVLGWLYLANSEAPKYLKWIAAGSTSLGFMVFFWSAHLVERAYLENGNAHNKTLLLFSYVIYSVLISLGLASVALAAIVVKFNPSNPGSVAEKASKDYQLALEVVGIFAATSHTEVPFQVSSGQINVGCESVAQASVLFDLPRNSKFIGRPSASWMNTANVSRAPVDDPKVAGNRAIASGHIRGLDRQNLIFAQNCPGGGHGELVLNGHYQTSVSTKEPKKVQMKAEISSAAAKPYIITLPTAQEMDIDSVEVVVNESGEAFHLRKNEGAKVFVDGMFKAEVDYEKRELVIEHNQYMNRKK